MISSILVFFFLMLRHPPRSNLTEPPIPYTTLCRSCRERAVTCSVAAGCVVFILAMLVGAATTHGGGPREFRNALILGIICGVTSWGATMRIVAETAGAIDRLIVRVRAAAKGEVDIAFDKGEREELPELVDSLDRLDRKSTRLNSSH